MAKEIYLFIEVDHPVLGPLFVTGYSCPADPEVNIYAPYGEVEMVFQGRERIDDTISKDGPLTFLDIGRYQDNLVCSGQPFTESVFDTWVRCYYPEPTPGPSRPPSNAREVPGFDCSGHIVPLLNELEHLGADPTAIQDAIQAATEGRSIAEFSAAIFNSIFSPMRRAGEMFYAKCWWGYAQVKIASSLRHPHSNLAEHTARWLADWRKWHKGRRPRPLYVAIATPYDPWQKTE